MVNLPINQRAFQEREKQRKRQEKWQREEQKLDQEYQALQNGADPWELNRNENNRLRHYAARLDVHLNPDHEDRRRAQRMVVDLERRQSRNDLNRRPLMIVVDDSSSDDERQNNRRQRPIARPR